MVYSPKPTVTKGLDIHSCVMFMNIEIASVIFAVLLSQ